MGHWLHTALLQSYLKFFPVDGLLGAGLWPNAAQKQFDHFWDPRFFPNVSDIVQALAPWIATLKEIVRGMGAAATPSMRSIPEVCKYFVTVAIQDALELAEDTPNNPVHAMLLNNATFENLLQQYKIDKQEGKWDSFKPLDLKAEVQQMRHDQSRLLQMVEKSMRKEQVEPPKTPTVT
ncbi:hypothetical protein CYMTET_53124 [Cymbomonas tetramitiformis]|uniref:Uncharacterized protein n=1 Tax=Cymbomonas tetramitiformis TaxID=36881 RepID=A0AAE0EQC9_9CHLO|nr:hypothetical protein CYMTET_53124 [Cymbomonas tetramitiformis]